MCTPTGFKELNFQCLFQTRMSALRTRSARSSASTRWARTSAAAAPGTRAAPTPPPASPSTVRHAEHTQHTSAHGRARYGHVLRQQCGNTAGSYRKCGLYLRLGIIYFENIIGTCTSFPIDTLLLYFVPDPPDEPLSLIVVTERGIQRVWPDSNSTAVDARKYELEALSVRAIDFHYTNRSVLFVGSAVCGTSRAAVSGRSDRARVAGRQPHFRRAHA